MTTNGHALLAYWSVRQKMNHVSSILLRHSIGAFTSVGGCGCEWGVLNRFNNHPNMTVTP